MELVKIVVTVPEDAADAIRQVMGDAGAGKVGDYSYCSFSSKGTGRFLPLDGAEPHIGVVDVPERVSEERIEFTCDRAIAAEVVVKLRAAHPYEEPAIDVYPLISL